MGGADAEQLYRDPLAWARARRIVLPAEYYGNQSALARAKAFSIAGMTRLDAIEAVKQALNAALASGETFADWKARLLADPKAIEAASLPAYRLDNIFRTNLQSAYMAGITRAQETPLAKKLRPFFQYDAINDSRTRPSHVAMDNYIAPADDPLWQTWTPPCGYRCRCTRISLTEAQARARGWTGEKKPLPNGATVDEGWGVHPSDQLETLQTLEKQKLSKADRNVAAVFEQSRPPSTPADFIALGRKITETLPDGDASPRECHAAIIELLKKEVGIDTPATVASKGPGAPLLREASKRFPDSWTQATDAIGPLYVKASSTIRGYHVSTLAPPAYPGAMQGVYDFGSVLQEQGAGYIMTEKGNIATTVHEYAHRIQSVLPQLDDLFQQLHRARTAGQPLRRLKDLKPTAGYHASEVSREDHYSEPYQGREYTGGAAGGAKEVMTMGIEAVLGPFDGHIRSAKSWLRFQDMYRKDREMFDFVVGLLRHWKP